MNLHHVIITTKRIVMIWTHLNINKTLFAIALVSVRQIQTIYKLYKLIMFNKEECDVKRV